jgi:hypothetical protein
MRFLKFILFGILLIGFNQIKAQSVSDLNAKIAALETKIVVLETKVSILEENNRAMNQRIDQIIFNLKSNNSSSNNNTSNNIVPQNTNEPTSVNTITPASTSKSPTSYGRCGATTKKGTQCSRSAKSNGYCWQHGGY